MGGGSTGDAHYHVPDRTAKSQTQSPGSAPVLFLSLRKEMIEILVLKRQREVDLYEFKVTRIYRESFRPARTAP